MSRLDYIEKVINSTESYEGIKSYPQEIKDLLEIKESLKSLPYEKVKDNLLNRAIELLSKYLSKGGFLELRDLLDFVNETEKMEDLVMALHNLSRLGLTDEGDVRDTYKKVEENPLLPDKIEALKGIIIFFIYFKSRECRNANTRHQKSLGYQR